MKTARSEGNEIQNCIRLSARRMFVIQFRSFLLRASSGSPLSRLPHLHSCLSVASSGSNSSPSQPDNPPAALQPSVVQVRQ